jgi:hypothetical protein
MIKSNLEAPRDTSKNKKNLILRILRCMKQKNVRKVKLNKQFDCFHKLHCQQWVLVVPISPWSWLLKEVPHDWHIFFYHVCDHDSGAPIPFSSNLCYNVKNVVGKQPLLHEQAFKSHVPIEWKREVLLELVGLLPLHLCLCFPTFFVGSGDIAIIFQHTCVINILWEWDLSPMCFLLCWVKYHRITNKSRTILQSSYTKYVV